MAKKKFYVVWQGKKPGIYTSWDEAKKQVDGVQGAQYKSFETAAEAQKAFAGNYWQYVQKAAPAGQPKTPRKAVGNYLVDSLAVDAACSGNPGDMEYRGVLTRTGEQVFHLGPLAEGTNNIGEFLAIVHGLAWLKQRNLPAFPIYSDSKIAQGWVKKGECKTKVERTPETEPIFVLIDRAEKWLAVNTITNPILKWETDVWGEIPADFGRK
jgi:ribonuclease HI